MVCLLVAVILRRPCERILEAFHDELAGWLNDEPRISRGVALGSALIGMLGHVVPDAVMHTDARPFAPFSDTNPFHNAISLGALHLALVALALIGLGWIRFVPAARTRSRNERPRADRTT